MLTQLDPDESYPFCLDVGTFRWAICPLSACEWDALARATEHLQILDSGRTQILNF